MFLILNSVSVTFVTNPELVMPSDSVMTHSLDQKDVMARKAKARKCTADCWKYPSDGREATQACDFLFCHPTCQKQFPKVHKNVCDISS
jgi:hypothetical protein